MNSETMKKIHFWESEVERNIRIHCPRVAARFQRMIDKEKKLINCENKKICK